MPNPNGWTRTRAWSVPDRGRCEIGGAGPPASESRTPLSTTPTNYRLKGELGAVRRGGATHERWQHKPTAKGTARIWYFVEGRTVFLEQVHTSHPNETK